MSGDILKTQPAINVYRVLLEPTVTLLMLIHVLHVNLDTQLHRKVVTRIHNVQVRIFNIFLNYEIYLANSAWSQKVTVQSGDYTQD